MFLIVITIYGCQSNKSVLFYTTPGGPRRGGFSFVERLMLSARYDLGVDLLDPYCRSG